MQATLQFFSVGLRFATYFARQGRHRAITTRDTPQDFDKVSAQFLLYFIWRNA